MMRLADRADAASARRNSKNPRCADRLVASDRDHCAFCKMDIPVDVDRRLVYRRRARRLDDRARLRDRGAIGPLRFRRRCSFRSSAAAMIFGAGAGGVWTFAAGRVSTFTAFTLTALGRMRARRPCRSRPMRPSRPMTPFLEMPEPSRAAISDAGTPSSQSRFSVSSCASHFDPGCASAASAIAQPTSSRQRRALRFHLEDLEATYTRTPRRTMSSSSERRAISFSISRT